MQRYLKPTDIIDCDNQSVQKKASDLIGGRNDIIQQARSLFYYVRDEIRYNFYMSKSYPENFRASKTLLRGEGYCVQKAVLLVALARAVGIPSGLGFARLKNHLLSKKVVNWIGTNILPFHGYAEFYLNGKWIMATPAFDLELCEKNRIIPVEFDGRNDAMLHAYNRDGKLHIEYIKDLGHNYDDLPLNDLWEAIIQTHGSKGLEPPER